MADWNNPNPIDTNAGGDTKYTGFVKAQSNFDDIYSKLNTVKKLQTGTTAPSTPAVGELWFDENTGILKRYDGTNWIEIVALPDLSNITSLGNILNLDGSGSGLDADTVDGKHYSEIYRGFKNRIINGDFSIWQRGASFTSSGYTADRWRYDTDTDDSATISKTATDGSEPFTSQSYATISLTAGTTGTYNKFSTRLEFPKLYFGKTVTLSFWAKADVAATITTKLAFVFSGTEYNPVSTNISIGTSWQRYSITFTLGTPTGFAESGSDYLDVALLLPVLTAVTIDIANVQLEEGDTATDFEHMPYDVQILRCMRYYYKDDNHVYLWLYGGSSSYAGYSKQFLVEMRVIPTINIDYGPSSASLTLYANRTTKHFCHLLWTIDATGSMTAMITADAEL